MPEILATQQLRTPIEQPESANDAAIAAPRQRRSARHAAVTPIAVTPARPVQRAFFNFARSIPRPAATARAMHGGRASAARAARVSAHASATQVIARSHAISDRRLSRRLLLRSAGQMADARSPSPRRASRIRKPTISPTASSARAASRTRTAAPALVCCKSASPARPIPAAIAPAAASKTSNAGRRRVLTGISRRGRRLLSRLQARRRLRARRLSLSRGRGRSRLRAGSEAAARSPRRRCLQERRGCGGGPMTCASDVARRARAGRLLHAELRARRRLRRGRHMHQRRRHRRAQLRPLRAIVRSAEWLP